MIRVGILSDTHLHHPDGEFITRCRSAFASCTAIIHAGDLTSVEILSAFQGKKVYGVHGNMCNQMTRMTLPEKQQVRLGKFLIGITHGAGPRHNIEERVFDLFPEADCIIYGHTHQPICHYLGTTLLINPGSFMGTGRYGAPGSYALLTVDDNGLDGKIFSF
ncbi:metallophosphoesterase family protein [Desulforhopalus singaporensis]|uniref:Phosphoesterase n=1 Tax=Desulforhopalus singaporensis TaxID=91360 RepID=A0A1H0JPP1_9BACT|nr:metallophosphoesterase family protein [Desulforhopalus singaporensis]SDO45533.1 hypothetical protein SAMN05660330_00269 [Desulforhopalus singaporensis]